MKTIAFKDNDTHEKAKQILEREGIEYEEAYPYILDIKDSADNILKNDDTFLDYDLSEEDIEKIKQYVVCKSHKISYEFVIDDIKYLIKQYIDSINNKED